MNFLSDIKVLELAAVLAGPSAGMFFAELGADVLKIENKRTNGDVTRSWKQSGEKTGGNVSAYFSSINYKKKYLQLDFSSEEDLAILISEIEQSDVIITNFKLNDDVKFGLTKEKIQEINPSIIQCQLFGFVSDKSRPAFDAVLQAETGFMHMNGAANGPPIKMPVALIDVLAGHQIKEAILLGLIQKLKTGKGSYFEMSLEEVAISSLVNQSTNWLMNGSAPERIGSFHPNIAPYGETIKCKDNRYLVLAVGSDIQFKNLCIQLGLDELSTDARFSTNKQRVINRKELESILSEKMKLENADDWMTKFNVNKIPAGKVKSLDEVFSSSVAKSMVRREIIDGVETKRPTSIAFQLIS